MFGFIGDYFKKQKTEQPAQVVIKSSRKEKNAIRYDEELIRELELDHARLVELFGRIWSEGFEKADYSRAAALISEFKGGFQAHLLTENVKFYVYLEQSLASDPHNLKIVKEFRSDMNEIANAVVKFCKAYQGVFSSQMIEQFKDDYAGVGEVLTRRVSLEEKSLYVLYQPR